MFREIYNTGGQGLLTQLDLIKSQVVGISLVKVLSTIDEGDGYET
jgi:hypothetical protein